MVNSHVKTPRVAQQSAALVEVTRQNQRIDRLHIIVTDVAGSEGIYSVYGPSGQLLPIVAVDDKGIGKLSLYAEEQVRLTGRTVSIISFTKRVLHETYRPLTTGDKK